VVDEDDDEHRVENPAEQERHRPHLLSFGQRDAGEDQAGTDERETSRQGVQEADAR